MMLAGIPVRDEARELAELRGVLLRDMARLRREGLA